MSYSWRQRLALAKERLKERLGLSEDDWEYMKSNMDDFCRESDEALVRMFKDLDIDDANELCDRLTDEQFDDLAKKIIEAVFEKLGYKKKGKKKKKKHENEQEEKAEEETTTESEDETLDEEERQQEEELVA